MSVTALLTANRPALCQQASPDGLLMVASNFPPVNSAGVYRSLRFAKYLPALNWRVHVLTIHPRSYEPGTTFDESLLDRLPESVAVHRTAALYPMNLIGRVKRVLRSPKADGAGPARLNGSVAGAANERASRWQRCKDAVTLPLMTPDQTIGWLPFALREGRRIVRRHDISAIYSSGPPWTNHLVGYRIKRATGKPWVADFRDPWVNADFNQWRMGDSWAARRHQLWERRVVQTADRVVANTQGSLEDMLTRYGHEIADKLVVIPNGFDPEDVEELVSVGRAVPEGPDADSLVDPKWGCAATTECGAHKLIIAHAGSFYGKRNVASLIRAVGNLRRQGAIMSDRLEVRLIGALRTGRDDEYRQVREQGVEDLFHLTEPLPHAECLRELAAADVLLLVQVGAPVSVPGKVFEYISLGKPILTLTGAGATADLVRSEQLGPCIESDDVSAIQSALLELYNAHSCGQELPSAPRVSRNRYDSRRLAEKLDEVIRRIS